MKNLMADGLPTEAECRAIATDVSDLTSKLSAQAAKIAERTGLRGPVYQIGGIQEPKSLEDMFKVLTTPAPLFRITRIGDVWDLFHSETVTLHSGKQEWHRISSCRWEIKALFLKHAKEIFSAYFAHAKEFIENVPEDIAIGERVLLDLADSYRDDKT
jgi:hypothetical protein